MDNQDSSNPQEEIKTRQLRPRTNNSILNYFQKIDNNKSDISAEDSYQGSQFSDIKESKQRNKNKRKKVKGKKEESEQESELDGIEEIPESDNVDFYGKLPKTSQQLKQYLKQVNQTIQNYKIQFFKEQNENKVKKSRVPDNAIPICADIRNFDFNNLAKVQLELTGRGFDVIMMDPPWQLSTSTPSRGVAIAYDSLADPFISNIPVKKLQTDGFIFIWVINAKYRFSCKLIEEWGYTLVDEITWVKKTINGKIAKGHGFYLQHAKESCLVGVKGNVDKLALKNIASDVIFSMRRGQSQKPEEIYEYVEQLVPNGYYLEIFGRRNNLRSNWVTIGNEI